jgi:hypothetical protein
MSSVKGIADNGRRMGRKPTMVQDIPGRVDIGSCAVIIFQQLQYAAGAWR